MKKLLIALATLPLTQGVAFAQNAPRATLPRARRFGPMNCAARIVMAAWPKAHSAPISRAAG